MGARHLSAGESPRELPEEDGDLQGVCRGLNILDVGNLGLRVEGHL